MGFMGLMGLMGHVSSKSSKSHSCRPPGDSGLRPLRLSDELKFAALPVEINEHGLAVADLAFQDSASERRFDLVLDRSFERARAIVRIEAGANQMRARGVCQLETDVTFCQALSEPVELYFDDLFEVLF